MDLKKVQMDLFGENRCLFVLEKKPGYHVHVHGEPRADGPEITKYLKDLAQTHSKREIDPKCLPIKRKHEGVDEKGFQYICKFLGTEMDILFNNGFSDEKLAELKKLSDDAREEVKASMAKYIRENYSAAPGIAFSEVHEAYRNHGLQFYVNQAKLPPPNFQKLVLWAIVTDNPSHHVAIAERI